MADGGSIQRYVLEELPVQPEHFRDVLRCVFHTILFNRVLGECAPREVVIEGLDFPYIRCDSVKVSDAVEQKIEHVCRYLSKNPMNNNQVGLSFFESNKWVLPVQLVPPCSDAADSELAKSTLVSALQRIVFGILAIVNSNQSHVPSNVALADRNGIVFPFEIHVPSEKTWGLDSLLFWKRENAPQSPIPSYDSPRPHQPVGELIRE